MIPLQSPREQSWVNVQSRNTLHLCKGYSRDPPALNRTGLEDAVNEVDASIATKRRRRRRNQSQSFTVSLRALIHMQPQAFSFYLFVCVSVCLRVCVFVCFLPTHQRLYLPHCSLAFGLLFFCVCLCAKSLFRTGLPPCGFHTRTQLASKVRVSSLYLTPVLMPTSRTPIHSHSHPLARSQHSFTRSQHSFTHSQHSFTHSLTHALSPSLSLHPFPFFSPLPFLSIHPAFPPPSSLPFFPCFEINCASTTHLVHVRGPATGQNSAHRAQTPLHLPWLCTGPAACAAHIPHKLHRHHHRPPRCPGEQPPRGHLPRHCPAIQAPCLPGHHQHPICCRVDTAA